MNVARTGRLLALAGLLSTNVLAQEAPATSPTSPCRANTCVVIFDWGGGAFAPDNDRVFGSGNDFEAAFRMRLSEIGYKIANAGARAPFQVTVRVTMARALCNSNPGLNPDKTCRTAATAAVSVAGLDSNLAPMKAIQIAPRCPDPYAAMKMTQFARYTADVMAFTLEGAQTGATRPPVKC